MSRLDEIKARVEKATEGPWQISDRDGCDIVSASPNERPPAWMSEEDKKCWRPGNIVTTDSGCYGPSLFDAAFIAHSREDVPWLIRRIERLEKSLERFICYGDTFGWAAGCNYSPHHQAMSVLGRLDQCDCELCKIARARAAREEKS